MRLSSARRESARRAGIGQATGSDKRASGRVEGGILGKRSWQLQGFGSCKVIPMRGLEHHHTAPNRPCCQIRRIQVWDPPAVDESTHTNCCGGNGYDGMLGFDRLYGDEGPDYVTDWDNNENGYDAGDYLYGGGGKDTLDAQQGCNDCYVGEKPDTFDGGALGDRCLVDRVDKVISCESVSRS